MSTKLNQPQLMKAKGHLMSELEAIYWDGHKAYNDGLDQSHNPFIGKDSHFVWLQGYYDAYSES